MWKAVNSVLRFLGSIPQDKLLHFIAGAMTVALVSVVRCLAPYSVLFGILAGALKEWYDSRHGGSVELMDFVATTAGAGVMWMAVWLYYITW